MSHSLNDGVPLISPPRARARWTWLVAPLYFVVVSAAWIVPTAYAAYLEQDLDYTWISRASAAIALQLVSTLLSYMHFVWSAAISPHRGYLFVGSLAATVAWALTTASYAMALAGSNDTKPTLIACAVLAGVAAVFSAALCIWSASASFAFFARSGRLQSPAPVRWLIWLCVIAAIALAIVVACVHVDQSVAFIVFPYFGPVTFLRTTQYNISAAAFVFSTAFASVCPLLYSAFADSSALTGLSRLLNVVVFFTILLCQAAIGGLYVSVFHLYESRPIFLFPYAPLDYTLLPIPIAMALACLMNLVAMRK